MKSEEQIWFENWQNGNDAAFDALFRKIYKSLCYVAATKIGDIHHAEDIVQELFADIFKRRNQINLTTTIDKYLYGALFFKCREFNLKNSKQPFINDISIDKEDSSSIPSEMLELMEIEASIFKAIDTLPEKCREVFVLSRFENKKNKEIASDLNISIKTVETHISHALKQLKLLLSLYIKLLVIIPLHFLIKFLL